MTPKQLSEVLMVRRRREERALSELREAQAIEAQAREGVGAAWGALNRFDAALQARLNAFSERTKIGTSPAAIQAMSAFHSDQLALRPAFFDAIAMAERAVAMAEEHVAEMRRKWMAASQAAENLQDLTKVETLKVLRRAERRQEQESDEVASTRSFHFGRD